MMLLKARLLQRQPPGIKIKSESELTMQHYECCIRSSQSGFNVMEANKPFIITESSLKVSAYV
jgi:hypothetical protein